jgi:quinol monooxygenase YgiN
MFLLRTELLVAPGHLAEVEALVGKVYAIARTQPGFDRAGLGASTAYPTRYASLSLWQRRADIRAFLRGDAYATFMQQQLPPRLLSFPRPQEVYEVVQATLAEPLPTPGIAASIDWAIRTDPASVAAFTARRQEAAQLMQHYGHGFVSYRLARALADPARYLSLFVFESEATLQASIGRPEYQQWLGAHPLTEHTTAPLQTELFDLVQVLIPTPAG